MGMTKALEILGGGQTFGRPRQAGRWLEVAAVRAGFPIAAVTHLERSGRLSMSEIAQVIMPRRTLAHRKGSGRLTAEQSERALRVARVIAAAEDTFGPEGAHTWLRRPTAALDGHTPLGLLDTEPGVRQVLDLLGRIDHGLAA